MPDPTATLTLHHRCGTCDGMGAVQDLGRYYCDVCRAGYGEAERLAASGTQPCRHLLMWQRHGTLCTACDGRGEWEEAVTLGTLREWLASEEGDGPFLAKAMETERRIHSRHKGRR